MEIQVFSTFWNPLSQNKFFVKTIAKNATKEYKDSYHAGEWNFKIYDGDKIIWEGEEIGILKRYGRKKEIITESELYPLRGCLGETYRS